MRIIAGALKSRTLVAPKGTKTRPTTDRARESLFNVLALQIEFEGASVLDLFAGSGALGFEALSRGATRVLFVEEDRDALQALQTNRTHLRMESATELIRGDVYRKLPTIQGSFRLILADAPYDDVMARTDLPRLLIESSLLNDDGLIVIEHRKTDALEIPPACERVRTLTAGEAAFTILRKLRTGEKLQKPGSPVRELDE